MAITIRIHEARKNERSTTRIETYVGFDELIRYAEAEYLLEDVVDVLSEYYTYEDETFDEDQAKDDPEFVIKIEGGDERADFYSEDIFYVHLPNKEAAGKLARVLGGELDESKKSESIASDIRKNKPQVHIVGEYIDTVDYSDNFDDYDDLLDRFEGQQDFVAIETKIGTVESPLAYDREKNLLLILDDELPADEDKEFAKELVQGFVDGKLEPVEKPLTDDYVCIVDGNTYTATAFVEKE